jgi:hypothetical protein
MQGQGRSSQRLAPSRLREQREAEDSQGVTVGCGRFRRFLRRATITAPVAGNNVPGNAPSPLGLFILI